MREPDRWFIRELQNTIDKRYYVQYDSDPEVLLCWDVHVEIDGEDKIIGSFEHLNAKALTELRYRKWLGRNFATKKERERYLGRDNIKAKEKGHEDNIDLIAHGFMEMHNMKTRKRFS